MSHPSASPRKPRSRPVIGITLDHEPGGPPGTSWSVSPWYALRQNYADAIAAIGGLPVALPHHPELADAMLDELDGLVVTGGAFDVDPSLYGDSETHATVILKENRTATELALTRGALARDMPLLGICGGEQLLAVALGGRLIQHIPDTIPNCLPHEQPNPRHEPGHRVDILPGSLLHRIAGAGVMHINSSHHQAVEGEGRYVISARAPDGVIEAIESDAYRFCLGVQWHPEYFIDQGDRKIFAALIAAASAYGAQGQPA